MKKYIFLLTFLLAYSFYLVPVFSQNEPNEVFEPFKTAFPNPTRPYVTFDHDLHIELTNNSCASCHHSYIDGRLTTEDSSDEPCISCHPKDKPGGTNLVMAYHKLCRGCHERQAGPVACGECHVRPK